ncbi:hypothetical protein [Nostoc sp.]|uniref:hypothetical protein n=1 Tax=Nostoc sp. TaxID=1180 RepID=UPI002FF17702
MRYDVANTTPVTLRTVATAQVDKPAHTTASPTYLFSKSNRIPIAELAANLKDY